MQRKVSGLYPYLRAWFLNFQENRISLKAAGLAFSTIIAIVPFLSILFAVFTSIHFFDEQRGELENFIFTNIIPNANETLTIYLKKFISSAKALSLFGAIVMLVVSVDLFFKLNKIISDIWRIRKKRGALQTLIIFWMAITAGPLFLAFVFFLNNKLNFFLADIPAGIVNIALNISLLGLFYLFHLIFPFTDVNRKAALAGALFTTIGLILLKLVFSKYFVSVATWKTIYGPLSVIPMFFLWIYLSWHIILISVQLVYFFSRGIYTVTLKYPKIKDYYSLRLLILLNQFYQQGRGAVSFTRLQKKLKADNRLLREILKALQNEKIIATINKKYLLLKPLTKIKIFDILKLFSLKERNFYFGRDKTSDSVLEYLKKIDNRLRGYIKDDYLVKLQ
ncbi:MAG TPA: YihY family inner membrane protein [Spirochaetota bacterium]|nr:YihY family inner membrane protein [Spirochaetota bacterium]